MKHSLFMWELAGAMIIFLLGSLIHFGYKFTGEIKLFTAIFAVNESIWEHAKLTFWAPLIFATMEFFFIGKFYPNFITAKTFSAIITTIVMVVLFYSLIGITGYHSLATDLLIYEISIIFGLIISYKITLMNPLPYYTNKLSIVIILLFLFIFYLFSYNPPKLPFFKCSSTGKYGL